MTKTMAKGGTANRSVKMLCGLFALIFVLSTVVCLIAFVFNNESRAAAATDTPSKKIEYDKDPNSLASEGAFHLFVEHNDNPGTAYYKGSYDSLNSSTSGAEGVLNAANSYEETDKDKYGNPYSDTNKNVTFHIEMTNNYADTSGMYNNTSYIYCPVYINLNKHTLTSSTATDTKSSLFSAECKGGSIDAANKFIGDINFTIYNGNIVINGMPLIYASAWSSNYGNTYRDTSNSLKATPIDGRASDYYKTFFYTFDNVTFSYGTSAGTDALNNPLVNYVECPNDTSNTDMLDGTLSGLDITLNNCIFDLTKNSPKVKVLFDAQDSNADTSKKIINTVANITVNGGEIKCNTTLPTTLAENNVYKDVAKNESGSKISISSQVKFGPNKDGKYVKLTVPANTEVPGKWEATTVDDPEGIVGVYGQYTEAKDSLTFAKFDSTGTTYYMLPAVQYEGKGDYVVASTYYSTNFAVFLTTMDDNGNNGNWTYLGGANKLFNGEITTDTVYGVQDENGKTAHTLISDENTEGNHLVAVMTKDCALDTAKYTRFSEIRGKLTYDLGGHTLSWNANTRFINAEATAAGVGYETTFEIKNGVVETLSGAFIATGASGTISESSKKVFDIKVTNLEIKATSDSEWNTDGKFLFLHNNNSTATFPIRVTADVTFTDCTFDLTNSLTETTLFDAYDNPTDETVISETHITVMGGEVISKKTSVDLAKRNAAFGSSVTFGTGTDGEYLTVTLPSDSEKPIVALDNEGHYLGNLNVARNTDTKYEIGSLTALGTGDLMTYTTNDSSADEVLYTLEAAREVDGYGMVPAYYYDDIAIFIFNGDVCVGAYEEWSYAVRKASLLDNSTIFLRHNLDHIDETGTISILQDGDDGDSVGTLTVDLNRNTVTRDGESYLIYLDYDAQASIDKKSIVIKNGSVVNAAKWGPICINYHKNLLSVIGDETYAYLSYEFDNVSFSSTETGGSPTFWIWEDDFDALVSDEIAKTKGFIKVNAVFNDCNISSASEGYAPIPMRHPQASLEGRNYRNRTIFDVTVNGGSITAKNNLIFEGNKESEEPFTVTVDGTIYTYSTPNVDNTDKITLGKDEDGNYPTLNLPSDAARPTQAFNGSEGKVVFVQQIGDGETVYTPMRFDSLDVKLKTNIVFASEMLMYAYIPSDSNMTSFTVDGTEFLKSGFGSLPSKVIDGKLHYAVAVNLPAREAARDIPVTMTMLFEGDGFISSDFTVRFTVDTVSYASTLISSEVDEAQKTLIKDTLAYIKSAYAYFNAENASTVGARIDEVLGNYNATFTKSEGTTTATTGFASSTLVLSARPAVRFYIADSYENSLFSFTQNGAALGYLTGEENGNKYIEIGMLAYRMPSEITYSIDGKEIGTYHINTYVDFATGDYSGDDKTELVDLVQKFYIYCQSALVYKTSLADQS